MDEAQLPSSAFSDLRAGRDILIHIGHSAAAAKFSGKVQAFVEEYLISEIGTQRVPFGGRTAEIDRLDQWFDSPKAAPRLMLVGPAGRGKSALLVNWIQHLTLLGRTGDRVGQWHLAFMPISIRFDTNRPDVFYEALAARIAEIIGLEIPSAQTDATAYYEDQCRILLGRALDDGKRILIVVDGADEALGNRFNARWFPRSNGESLRLLVSARILVGDVGAAGWVRRLGWSEGVRYTTIELMPLDRPAVQDLLITTGAPLDVLAAKPEIVDKLYRLSEGEPLVLRMYVEDLWLRGEGASALGLEDLDRIKPGLSGYFLDWMSRQRETWRSDRKEGNEIDEGTITAYLMILACAHGPLSAEDIREIAGRLGAEARGIRVQDALQPLRRFVIGVGRVGPEGGGGYVLSHPRFGVFLQEDYLEAGQIRSALEAFGEWGANILDRLSSNALRPEQVPSYALQYLSQHMLELGAPPSQFVKLAGLGWLRAWEAQEGGYRGFSRDIVRLSRVLADGDDSFRQYFSMQLRCALTLSSISSVVSRSPKELVVLAVRHGLLPLRQALHWLEFHPGIRAEVVVALAPTMTESDVDATLNPVRSITDGLDRAAGLIALSDRMSGPDRDSIASEILQALAPRDLSLYGGHLGERIGALIAQYARNIPQRLIAEALGIARKIVYGEGRVRALIGLAVELLEPLRTEALKEALATMSSVADASALFEGILEAIGPNLLGPLLDDVVQEVSRLDDRSRAGCFESLMRRMPPPYQLLAVEAAQRIEQHTRRQEALGGMIRHVPLELKGLVILGSLALTRNSSDYIDTLLQIAPGICGPIMDVVLRHARLLLDDDGFIQTVGCLRDQMTSQEADDVLRGIFSMRDGAVGHCIAELSARVSDAFVKELWLVAVGLRHPPARTEAILALVPRLTLEQQRNALGIIRTLPDTADKIGALIIVAASTPELESMQIWRETLHYVATAEFSAVRESAIYRCVGKLPRQLIIDLFPIAITLRGDYEFVNALRRIRDHLVVLPEFEKCWDRSRGVPALLLDLLHRAEGIRRPERNRYGDNRETALGIIAQVCPPGFIPKMLDICSSYDSPELFTMLASRLDGVKSQELWRRALQAADQLGYTNWLYNRVQFVPDELVHDVMPLVSRIEGETWRCGVLAVLARRLPTTARAPVFGEFLELLDRCQDGDGWSRSEALQSVVPLLPADLLVKAITIALSLGSTAALSCCLRCAPIDQSAKVLTEALDGNPEPAVALASLAPRPADNDLDLIIESVRSLRKVVDRAACLIQLSGWVCEDSRQAIWDDAADIVSAIEDDFDRASMLTKLASLVRPDNSVLLLQRALRAARNIGDETSQFDALLHILRALPTASREKFVPELRERLATLEVGDARAALVLTLVEVIPTHESETLIADELALAVAVKHERVMSKVLFGLAPNLSGEQLSVAWRAAKTIKDSEDQMRVVRALFPRLPVEEVVSLFRDPRQFGVQPQTSLLRLLAGRIPTEFLPELLARSREAAPPWQLADTLIAAAARLPRHERPALLREAASIARHEGSDLTFAEASVALAECCPEESRSAISREALDAVMVLGYRYAGQRMRVLLELIPFLPRTMYAVVLSDASWAARNDDCCAAVLAAFRSFLPSDLFSDLIPGEHDSRFLAAISASAAAVRPELLSRALELAEAQSGHATRSKALAAIIPHLTALSRKSSMASFVDSAAHLERKELLPLLQLLMPTIVSFEGVDGIGNVARTILEVGDWFK